MEGKRTGDGDESEKIEEMYSKKDDRTRNKRR